MLTVLRRDENDYVTPKGERKVRWVCKCECGNIKSVVAASLLNGRTQSCGKHKTSWNKGSKISESPSYEEHETYYIGTLQTGERFVIDKEDFNIVSQYNWYITPEGYLKAGASIGTLRFMHRLLLNAQKGQYVDHINHNKLDNRKCNLRICTASQNGVNSKHTGICFDKRYNKWFVSIPVNGKNKFYGYYDNRDDAISVRKKLEELYFGEFSYDNSQKIANKNGVILNDICTSECRADK